MQYCFLTNTHHRCCDNLTTPVAITLVPLAFLPSLMMKMQNTESYYQLHKKTTLPSPFPSNGRSCQCYFTYLKSKLLKTKGQNPKR